MWTGDSPRRVLPLLLVPSGTAETCRLDAPNTEHLCLCSETELHVSRCSTRHRAVVVVAPRAAWDRPRAKRRRRLGVNSASTSTAREQGRFRRLVSCPLLALFLRAILSVSCFLVSCHFALDPGDHQDHEAQRRVGASVCSLRSATPVATDGPPSTAGAIVCPRSTRSQATTCAPGDRTQTRAHTLALWDVLLSRGVFDPVAAVASRRQHPAPRLVEPSQRAC